MDSANVLAVSAVFMLAGCVKGVTGMGLPTVAVSLLTIWMAPARAAGLLVAPSLLTNVAQCRGPESKKLFRMLWPTWLVLVIVTVWMPVPRFAAAIHEHLLLGLVLLAYGLWGLWRPESSKPFVPGGQIGRTIFGAIFGTLVGAITGVVTALTAVFVFPLVPYLQALRFDKDTLVQAMGISFTVVTIALAIRLLRLQQLPAFSAESMLALPAALFGMWIGARVRARITAARFQRALFVVLIGLGAANLLRGA